MFMAYSKINYVLIFIWTMLASPLLAVNINVEFEEQRPNVVLVGSNLTFSWTYSGDIDKVDVIRFGIVNTTDSGKEILPSGILARYIPSTHSINLESLKPEPYCENITWVGDTKTTDPIAAFKMVNISMEAHLQVFGVALFAGGDDSTKTSQIRNQLFISEQPQVELSVSAANTTAGEQVTIQCKTVKGRPSPTISWYRNNKLLEGKTGMYLLNNEKVEEKHAGSYKCVGKNDAGVGSSEVVYLAVKGKDGSVIDKGGRTSSGGLSNSAILGIVFGLLAVVIIVIILVLVWFKLKKKSSKSGTSNVDRDEAKTEMVPSNDNTQKDQVWL